MNLKTLNFGIIKPSTLAYLLSPITFNNILNFQGKSVTKFKIKTICVVIFI